MGSVECNSVLHKSDVVPEFSVDLYPGFPKKNQGLCFKLQYLKAPFFIYFFFILPHQWRVLLYYLPRVVVCKKTQCQFFQCYNLHIYFLYSIYMIALDTSDQVSTLLEVEAF